MPPTDPSPPPVRVILPDGHELHGLLHARGQFPRDGWMYWVALPMCVQKHSVNVSTTHLRNTSSSGVTTVTIHSCEPTNVISYGS